MLRAVEFHNDADGRCREIDNVASNRHLPAEPYSLKTVRAEHVPQTALGFRHILAQTFRIAPQACRLMPSRHVHPSRLLHLHRH